MHERQGMKSDSGETMLRAALTASLVLLASAVAAQEFPNKTIRIVVGFPAGGPSDVPARIIAEKLRVALGQPVIVENKTGAAGMIALNDVLAQPRDGHTLLLCSYIDAINPLLYRKVTYKHALRAGLIPVITIFGLDVAGMLAGAIFTERIFDLPGLGNLVLESLNNYDLPVIMGTVLVASIFLVAANLVVDIVYSVSDPRVRLT